MKLKTHKVILRLPTPPDEFRQETVFLWEHAGTVIVVKFRQPNGLYRVSKMHRPDARVIWGDLISKGYEIIDMTDAMQMKWNKGKNIWESDDRNS